MLTRMMIMFSLFIASCSESEQRSDPKYVDLKRFFEEEIVRFEKQKVKIDKSVSRNGVSESKKNISVNWKDELGLFIESDINKPAWKNSYRVTADSRQTLYTALDGSLRTRSIVIKKNQQGRVIQISIINRSANSLYSSIEELSYVPDFEYKIIKRQDITFLGNNHYEITGILK